MRNLIEYQNEIINKYSLDELLKKKKRESSSSLLQNNVEKILKEGNYEFEQEHLLDTFSIDYYIPSKEIFIECLGPTHYLRYKDQVNGRTNIRNFIIKNKYCNNKTIFIESNKLSKES